MSASLMLDFELEYMNRLQCNGWNSVAVMTSVSSSMLTGLISTMSRVGGHDCQCQRTNNKESGVLKLWLLMFKFQRLIRRSSADM